MNNILHSIVYMKLLSNIILLTWTTDKHLAKVPNTFDPTALCSKLACSGFRFPFRSLVKHNKILRTPQASLLKRLGRRSIGQHDWTKALNKLCEPIGLSHKTAKDIVMLQAIG